MKSKESICAPLQVFKKPKFRKVGYNTEVKYNYEKDKVKNV